MPKETREFKLKEVTRGGAGKYIELMSNGQETEGMHGAGTIIGQQYVRPQAFKGKGVPDKVRITLEWDD